jgi:hypothetical protein
MLLPSLELRLAKRRPVSEREFDAQKKPLLGQEYGLRDPGDRLDRDVHGDDFCINQGGILKFLQVRGGRVGEYVSVLHSN